RERLRPEDQSGFRCRAARNTWREDAGICEERSGGGESRAPPCPSRQKDEFEMARSHHCDEPQKSLRPSHRARRKGPARYRQRTCTDLYRQASRWTLLGIERNNRTRMADIVDQVTRSRMMSRIRGKDTKPE